MTASCVLKVISEHDIFPFFINRSLFQKHTPKSLTHIDFVPRACVQLHGGNPIFNFDCGMGPP